MYWLGLYVPACLVVIDVIVHCCKFCQLSAINKSQTSSIGIKCVQFASLGGAGIMQVEHTADCFGGAWQTAVEQWLTVHAVVYSITLLFKHIFFQNWVQW